MSSEEFEAALKEHINAWASSALDGGRLKTARFTILAMYDALRVRAEAAERDSKAFAADANKFLRERGAARTEHAATIERAERAEGERDALRAAVKRMRFFIQIMASALRENSLTGSAEEAEEFLVEMDTAGRAALAGETIHPSEAHVREVMKSREEWDKP